LRSGKSLDSVYDLFVTEQFLDVVSTYLNHINFERIQDNPEAVINILTYVKVISSDFAQIEEQETVQMFYLHMRKLLKGQDSNDTPYFDDNFFNYLLLLDHSKRGDLKGNLIKQVLEYWSDLDTEHIGSWDLQSRKSFRFIVKIFTDKLLLKNLKAANGVKTQRGLSNLLGRALLSISNIMHFSKNEDYKANQFDRSAASRMRLYVWRKIRQKRTSSRPIMA